MSADTSIVSDTSAKPAINRSLSDKCVLQVIPDLAAGGAERTTLEVTEALIQSGARALVASAGGRLENELIALGGELIRRKSLRSKNPYIIWRNASWIADIVRSQNVSIIHARSRAPAWSAYWAAKRTHLPFVTTYHGAYGGKSSLKKWYNSVMARGETVIANSSFIAEHVALTYPDALPHLVTIPRGVDQSAFSPENVSSDRINALKNEWFNEAPAKGRIILLPGRLTAWKGQYQAVEAIAQLVRGGHSDITLVLAGDDQGRLEYRQSLLDLVNRERLHSQVRLVGHCSDMPAALALADIVLAPSQEPEAFGRVAAEAGAMGKPSVVSNIGGQVEIVAHGETGLCVPPKDPSKLADAIRRLLDLDAMMLADMGKKAAVRVNDRFSKTALQQATLGVYERCLRTDSLGDE